MQEEVNLLRRDPADCLLSSDKSLVDLVDCDSHGRLRSTFPGTGLEEPQLTPLNGEFHVLHVAVVVLELNSDIGELLCDLGHVIGKLGDGQCWPDSGHNIFTLSVDEIVTFEVWFARGCVPAHCDTGRRIVSGVAKDHRHDVHRSAEIMRRCVRRRDNRVLASPASFRKQLRSPFEAEPGDRRGKGRILGA